MAAGHGPTVGLRFIPPSDPDAVLVEQLEFLMEYHGVCHPGPVCSDCQRLAMIRVELLRPFEDGLKARAVSA